MSEIELPYVRLEVRSVIERFADPEYQERVWRGGDRSDGLVHDIDEDIMLLYDDSQVLPDPASAVGDVVYPDEVPPLLRFGQLLGRVIDDLPHDADEVQYLDHPDWSRVVQAAAHVLVAWHDGSPPEGNPDGRS